MSQKEERQKAIETARKLHARAMNEGSSENEVEFAMKRFGETMDTFNLTMDEIHLSGLECKEIKVTHSEGATFHLGTVAVAIANFCDCVVYRRGGPKVQKRTKDGQLVYDKKNGRPHYEKATYTNHFYGLEQDAEMAAFLMELVRAAAVNASDDFKKTEAYKTSSVSKTALTKGFVDGFAARIVRRLNELKEQREAEMEKARAAREEMGEGNLDAERAAAERRAGRSTDLVLLKDKKVKDDFKAQFGWEVKYRNTRTSYGTGWAGRSHGGAAADNVNLSRPVGNGGGYSGQRLLG